MDAWEAAAESRRSGGSVRRRPRSDPYEKIDAESFARQWIEAWNGRNLEAVLSHYSDSVVFHSPRIAVVTGEAKQSVNGKAELRRYWTRALELAPDLHFELSSVLVGSDALTILYRNHRGQNAAETLLFGADGLVVQGIAAFG